MMPYSEDPLLTGLSHDNYEATQLSAAFWETVWPQLVEYGWEKKVVHNLLNHPSKSNSTILATRKDLDVSKSEEGTDYYTRIKDVIERINQRSNDFEAALADQYRRAISKPNYRTRLNPPRRSTLIPRASRLDLSWKDSRKNYPKKSSMIGADYQVAVLPAAGSIVQAEFQGSSIYYDRIWDPNAATEKGILLAHGKDGISSFPYYLRDAALQELPRVDYNMKALQSAVLKPFNGHDWSEEQKEQFQADILRFRRNIPAVTESMKVPLGTCQAYYLGKFKSSTEYLLLKTICSDERQSKGDDSHQDSDVCAICGDGGSLIICDGCEGEYHMNCLNPPLQSVPAGYWLCDECVDAKALVARDVLLEGFQFFRNVTPGVGNTKKRSSSMLSTDSTDGVLSSSTTSDAVSSSTTSEAVKKYHQAQQFISALSACSFKIDEILRNPFD